jgi:hypothetical protein
MAELKTKPTNANVLDFLNKTEDLERRKDCLTILELMKEASGVEPVMWGDSIVGFGLYRYTYKTGHSGEWPIIGFSPRKNDLTLYLMPGMYGFETVADLMEKLGKYKTGRSCLYIKKLTNINLDVLKELIHKSVEAMADKRVDK